MPRKSSRIAQQRDNLVAGLCVDNPPGSHFELYFAAIGVSSARLDQSINIAKKSDPDTLTFDEAMKDENREKWI